MEIKDRLRKWLKTRVLESGKSMSENLFCKKVGLGNSFFRSGIEIGSDKLRAIHRIFPDFPYEYIVLNEGSLDDDGSLLVKEPDSEYNIKGNCKELLSAKNEIIVTQQKTIDTQDMAVEQMKSLIELLKEKNG